jgi:hypothetical protein
LRESPPLDARLALGAAGCTGLNRWAAADVGGGPRASPAESLRPTPKRSAMMIRAANKRAAN